MAANGLSLRERVEDAGGTALPDTSAWVNRFEIRSSSSDSVYVLAQSRSGRWWSCECFGFRRHRHCHHLKTLGLPGHHQPYEPQLPAKRG